MPPRGRRAQAGKSEAVAVEASENQEVDIEASRSTVEELAADLCFVPEVFVFDLDDTLWRGDIDLTSGPPFRFDTSHPDPEHRVVAKEGDGISLFPDVPGIFEWLEIGGHRAAVASSTGRGDWAEKVLQMFTTARGTSYSSIAAVKEMHRAESVANRSKAVHLKQIAGRAGCDVRDMVFFDNMQHNIADGESIQVTSCYTPNGLTWSSLAWALREFDRRALARAAGEDPCA